MGAGGAARREGGQGQRGRLLHRSPAPPRPAPRPVSGMGNLVGLRLKFSVLHERVSLILFTVSRHCFVCELFFFFSFFVNGATYSWYSLITRMHKNSLA
jgi:hypothetical protein